MPLNPDEFDKLLGDIEDEEDEFSKGDLGEMGYSDIVDYLDDLAEYYVRAYEEIHGNLDGCATDTDIRAREMAINRLAAEINREPAEVENLWYAYDDNIYIQIDLRC